MYTGFTVRHKVLENQNSFEIALYIDDLDSCTMSMVFFVESALHYSVYKARETYGFLSKHEMISENKKRNNIRKSSSATSRLELKVKMYCT